MNGSKFICKLKLFTGTTEVLIEGEKVTGPGSTFIWTFKCGGTFLGSTLGNMKASGTVFQNKPTKKATLIQILSGIKAIYGYLVMLLD